MTVRPWIIHAGDCRIALAAMPEESVDACVTDTPYGLSTLLDPPNLDREALWQKLTAGQRELPIVTLLRAWLDTGENPVMKGRGFMGKEWDALVPPPNTWREVWRVLKPGAYCLAFAGTRTYDLITLSMRLAAFEIEDTAQWLYGGGMPKRVRLDLMIDEHFGESQKVNGEVRRSDRAGNATNFHMGSGGVSSAVTADAARFVGWDRASRPGWEPIIVACKPLRGTIAETALRYGTGGMNADGCRIPRGDGGLLKWGAPRGMGYGPDGAPQGVDNGPSGSTQDARGGFPANVIIDEGKLQVWRLRDTLAAETREVIRSYYAHYDSMPVMQERLHCVQEPVRRGPEEVLQSGLLRVASECDEYGCEPPNVRAHTRRGRARVDEGSRTEECKDRSGTREVSRVMDDTRVQAHQHVCAVRCVVGDGQGDAAWSAGDRRAPSGHGVAPGPSAPAVGNRPPLQRGEDGQQDRELGTPGRCNAQARAPVAREGSEIVEAGERALDVFERDIPDTWRHFFYPTDRFVIDIASPVSELERQAEGSSRFFYTAKASTSERDKGLENMPTLTPGERSGGREEGSAGINGYAGTRGENGRNIGPCVKPISLMRYLVRRACPPGAFSEDMAARPIVLDCFMGSGSTGVAAMVEGVRFVGCEMIPEYVEVARLRLQHAYALPREEGGGEGEAAAPQVRMGGQATLF